MFISKFNNFSMKYTKNKGFTLIELLVVIAIIGILASVVLVSLNSARSKGKDTRVVSAVNQLRTAFEAGYTGTSYPDLVVNATTTAGPNAASTATLSTDAAANGGVINFVTNGALPITAYAIYGKLVSDNTKYFCIDSTGKTNPLATTNTAVTCP